MSKSHYFSLFLRAVRPYPPLRNLVLINPTNHSSLVRIAQKHNCLIRLPTYGTQVVPPLKPQRIRRRFSSKQHLCRPSDTKTVGVLVSSMSDANVPQDCCSKDLAWWYASMRVASSALLLFLCFAVISQSAVAQCGCIRNNRIAAAHTGCRLVLAWSQTGRVSLAYESPDIRTKQKSIQLPSTDG